MVELVKGAVAPGLRLEPRSQVELEVLRPEVTYKGASACEAIRPGRYIHPTPALKILI